MTIKASGRSALIVAAGLFVCFAGPAQAASNAAAGSTSETAGAPHGSHLARKFAHRRSGKSTLISAAARKLDNASAAADDADTASAIPPSVANANAQMNSAETPAGNAAAMTARANDILQGAPDKPADGQPASDNQVVSADQLNDVDRSLRDSAAPAPVMAMASADTPTAPAAPVAASSSEHSTWEETSLIGKIFIGFGALLTMASAARMFMA